MKTKTTLPGFHGFYGSFFEDPDTYGELQYINELRVEKGFLELDDTNAFEFDYTTYYKDCCSVIVDSVEEFLMDLNIIKSATFERLVSPKYYNYSNDQIYCTIDLRKNNFKRYLLENSENLATYLKNTCSSYDGFISFYPNDLQNWLVATNNFINCNETEINILLNFILDNENFDLIDQIYNVGMKNIPYLSVNNVEYLMTL